MHQLTNYVYIIIIQSVSEPMHVVIIMIERQQSLTHTHECTSFLSYIE